MQQNNGYKVLTTVCRKFRIVIKRSFPLTLHNIQNLRFQNKTIHTTVTLIQENCLSTSAMCTKNFVGMDNLVNMSTSRSMTFN